MAGLKRYKFEAEKFNEEKKDYVMDTLEDHLGLVLKNKGLFAQAKENFEYSIKLNPDYELAKKELNI